MLYQIVVIIFLIALMAPSSSTILAQEIQFADNAQQKSIEINITEQGKVHVKHIVEESSTPNQISLIKGTASNIQVTDIENGQQIQHGIIQNNSSVLLFPTQNERVIEYELADVLTKMDGVWTWDFRYLETTKFFFPDNINTIFVGHTIITLDDKRGINCHGCEMKLRYFEEDENTQWQKVNWDKYEFDIQIISPAKVQDFQFKQQSKSLSFKTEQKDQFVTVVLPLELLWEPYEVYLDEQRILQQIYQKNATHVWLNINTNTAGTITIIGTTVIPEFSLFLPLMLGIGLLIVVLYRNGNLITAVATPH